MPCLKIFQEEKYNTVATVYIHSIDIFIIISIFAGSEELLKCDMVMLAMGFLGPEKKIVDELSVKLDARGNFQTPRNKYATSVPGLYAAGGWLHIC